MHGGNHHEARCSWPHHADVFKANHDQDFIFAQNVHSRSDAAKIIMAVRNGGVWRDGTKLLGKLTVSNGSFPIWFKKLVGRKSARAAR